MAETENKPQKCSETECRRYGCIHECTGQHENCRSCTEIRKAENYDPEDDCPLPTDQELDAERENRQEVLG